MRRSRSLVLQFACLLAAGAHPLPAQPGPGDVFRETVWKGPWVNASGWQRVTDDEAPHSGAQAFLPNPVNHVELAHVAGARRAEVTIEMWGGHPGTSDRRLRVNGHDWIEIPAPAAIPGRSGRSACAEGYMQFTYTTVAVPLEQLRDGDNTFEFHSGPQVCHDFGWGQWAVYGVLFRLYYGQEVPHAEGRIAGPRPGMAFGDSLSLQLSSSDTTIEHVDYIGRYRDFDVEGNGLYDQWHYNTRYGDIARHIGSATEPPFPLTWRTDWLPDQDQPVQVMARLRDRQGVYTMTESVDDLRLERPHRSVVLYEPYDVPSAWQTRENHPQHENRVMVPHDLEGAVAARMILTTWSGGHADSIGVNGRRVVGSVGPAHDYSYDEVPVSVDLLRRGTNELFTAARTEHHGIEVLWPGIALKIQYEGRADASATLGDPVVLGDSLAAGWALGDTAGVALDLLSAEHPVEGRTALQVDSGTRGWEIHLVRDIPLDVSRFRALRMSVRFAEIVPGPAAVFLMYLQNGFQSLLRVDRGSTGVELDGAGWQQVEVPLDVFELAHPYIESLRLRGRFAGRFWIDDLRFVPHPTTQVAGGRSVRPETSLLRPNYPNPFNGDTVIGFDLAATARVDLAIYNLAGQRVATLLRDRRPPGAHAIRWDGRDDGGEPLASGVYLSRLLAGGQMHTRKLLLLR